MHKLLSSSSLSLSQLPSIPPSSLYPPSLFLSPALSPSLSLSFLTSVDVAMSMSPPACNNTFATAACPHVAAQVNAVCPSLLSIFTEAPLSTNEEERGKRGGKEEGNGGRGKEKG